ncbi:ABC transporter permease [Subtercola sp. RTI3]|uniref:ABC transporter permease n=1 Tax=Subtercola sp. RTI3 TaxID=3048639 RepID=UPI002B2307DD|nr:ABC transporter permease [Subtercola sp. RTI3]MEA9984597.1 ABC transporter permease [Subtercola sp. RTI3]
MNTSSVQSRRSTSPLKQLILTSSRELFRNVKTIIAMLFMFFFFLLIIGGINIAINESRVSPIVSVTGSSQLSEELVSALDEQGIVAASGAPDSSTTAQITLSNDSSTVVLSTPHPPAWMPLVKAVHSVTGIQTSNITVIDADGSPEVDLLRANLSTVFIAGLMAIAFMGTSVPLVALRQRGTLRLLGTTPVSRLAFIVSQTPVRFALGVAEGVIILGIAVSQGYTESVNSLQLGVTFVLGLAMLFAFGYLLGSRAKNTDLITQITGFLPVIVLFTSGTVLPPGIYPPFISTAIDFIPSTWFMQAMSSDLAGTTPFTSIYLLWALMAGVGVAVALLAARLFKWDQGDL